MVGRLFFYSSRAVVQGVAFFFGIPSRDALSRSPGDGEGPWWHSHFYQEEQAGLCRDGRGFWLWEQAPSELDYVVQVVAWSVHDVEGDAVNVGGTGDGDADLWEDLDADVVPEKLLGASGLRACHQG
jgi:hypothetical protein